MKSSRSVLISLDGAADCFCGKGKMDTIINLFQAERSEPGTPDSNSGWLADFGQLFDSATRLGSSDRVDEVVAENPLCCTVLVNKHAQESSPQSTSVSSLRSEVPVWSQVEARYGTDSTRKLGLV